MASLEKCTDALLQHQAVQSSHCDHLHKQICQSEAQRGAATVSLQLLLGDVRRRLQDLDSAKESVRRLDEQLNSRKVKLSALILLYQKDQSKFEALRCRLAQSAARWADFPQQLAHLMRALQDRRAMQRDARVLCGALREAQRVYAAAWALDTARHAVQLEFSLQQRLIAACHAHLRGAADVTAAEREGIAAEAQAAKESLWAVRQRASALALRRLESAARAAKSAELFGPALRSRRDVLQQAVASAIALREEAVAAVARQRAAVERQRWERDGRAAAAAALTTAIAEAVSQRRDRLQQLRAAAAAADGDRGEWERKAVASRSRRAAAAARRREGLTRVAAALHLVDAVRRQRSLRMAQLSEQRRRLAAAEAALEAARRQHDALLRRRWEESRQRKTAAQLAAVAGEESLMRQPLEDDGLSALASLHMAERRARVHVAAAVECEKKKEAASARSVPSAVGPGGPALPAAGSKRRKPVKRRRPLTPSPSSASNRPVCPFRAGRTPSHTPPATQHTALSALFKSPHKPTVAPALPRPLPSSARPPKSSKTSARVPRPPQASPSTGTSPAPHPPALTRSALASAMRQCPATQRSAAVSSLADQRLRGAATAVGQRLDFPMASLHNGADLFTDVFSL